MTYVMLFVILTVFSLSVYDAMSENLEMANYEILLAMAITVLICSLNEKR